MLDIIVYNRSNWNAWQREIISLEKKIVAADIKLERLKAHVLTYNAWLIPHEGSGSDSEDEKVSDYFASEDEDEDEYDESPLYESPSSPDSTTGLLSANEQIAWLQEDVPLAELEAKFVNERVRIKVDLRADDIMQLHQQLVDIDLMIQEMQDLKTSLQEQKSECEFLVKDCEGFLHNLHHHPHQLFQHMFHKVCHSIDHYQHEHPLALSREERYFWGELINKLEWIRHFEQDDEVVCWQHPDAIRFTFLCGVLWEVKSKLALFSQQRRFINFDIDELLALTHIAKDGGLPDQLAMSPHALSCREFYQICLPKTPLYSNDHFIAWEKDRYKKALSVLENNSQGDLQHVIKALAVVNAVKISIETEAEPNYLFYTLILRTTHSCLKTPPDPNAYLYLKKYIEIAPGAPSAWSFLTPTLLSLSLALDAFAVATRIGAPTFFEAHAGKFAVSITALKAASFFSYRMFSKREAVSASLYEAAKTFDPTLTDPSPVLSYRELR
jgi:hypothetical protein